MYQKYRKSQLWPNSSVLNFLKTSKNQNFPYVFIEERNISRFSDDLSDIEMDSCLKLVINHGMQSSINKTEMSISVWFLFIRNIAHPPDHYLEYHGILRNIPIIPWSAVASIECPLQNKCLALKIVWRTNVENDMNDEKKLYFGVSKTPFKELFRNHKKEFNYVRYRNSTELSQYIWQLKDLNMADRMGNRSSNQMCSQNRLL